uniref:ATPase n=1 Tax=uncultured organism TaxID=155900 RepID=M1Q2M6_9ZZZZ|nr:ATPase [uncultured organism]
MMDKKVLNFFPGGNTGAGFYSFYDYLPYRAEDIFIIKGGPGTGKSTFMKRIGERALKEGFRIEKHWCSSDNNSLDGVVIPDLKTAIFDGTAPHMTDPRYPGAVEEIINLGQYWDTSYLRSHRDEIRKITTAISRNFENTYFYLRLAAETEKSIEKFYLEGFKSENAEKLIENIREDITPATCQKNGGVRHLFGSAITPEGKVNYYQNITAEMKKRYLLQGKSRTVKSKILKRIADISLAKGHDILFLHYALNPSLLAGIIISSMKIALLSDALGLLSSKKSTDILINTSDCLRPAIVNNNSREIETQKDLFRDLFDKAQQNLKKAKENHDWLEEFYVVAMDFEGVGKLREKYEKNLFA